MLWLFLFTLMFLGLVAWALHRLWRFMQDDWNAFIRDFEAYGRPAPLPNYEVFLQAARTSSSRRSRILR